MIPVDNQAAIHAKIEVHDKRIATLRARAARAGYSLFVIAATDGSSSFLVQRWGHSRELRDPAEVEAFLQQVSAP